MFSDTGLLQPSPGPTRNDKLFLGFLVVVLVAVATIGRMVYMEGQKNEITKKMPKPGSSGWSRLVQIASKATLSPAAALAETKSTTPGPTA